MNCSHFYDFLGAVFMGSNKSGKQVSFQKKIMTGPRVSVNSQYKKDNH
jgi:hypothetical protein